MQQYREIKSRHADAILFFRMGDFYEMFFEDALVAARALDLTLTSRSKDSSGGSIPMCGVPFHAVDGYLARLVRKGYRVAICEQVEDPRKAKGVVRREVGDAQVFRVELLDCLGKARLRVGEVWRKQEACEEQKRRTQQALCGHAGAFLGSQSMLAREERACLV